MERREYVRDKRSPTPKNETVSRVMSANRAVNTRPETLLRKALWASGKRGYRLHQRVHGIRPDIVYPKKKIAVFVHGCFWHRCPKCDLPLPKSNRRFWKNKFKANQERDERKSRSLRDHSWKVYVFWECEIERSAESCAKKIC